MSSANAYRVNYISVICYGLYATRRTGIAAAINFLLLTKHSTNYVSWDSMSGRY